MWGEIRGGVRNWRSYPTAGLFSISVPSALVLCQPAQALTAIITIFYELLLEKVFKLGVIL